MQNFRVLLGMGGVAPLDKPAAYAWQARLHWVMVGVALLALPAFYLDLNHVTALRWVSRSLDVFILLAFSAEFFWMLAITRHRASYIGRNWLDVLIITGAAVSVVGAGAGWVPLVRLLRLAYVSLLLARTLGAMRNLLAPGAAPYLLGWGLITLGLAGAGFYWLEPTVHSYGDGLWLAFTTGSTVGYGDIVPTTTASRIFAALMAIMGLAILSLMTARIAAFLIGEDEKRSREELHQDIKALHLEVQKLRSEIAALSSK